MSDLKHYLPKTVLDFVEKNATEDGIRAPGTTQFEGAVLFADIAGFSTMAQKLSFYANTARSKLGTEILAQRLNLFMGPMVTICDKWGGDVSRFAGDAMIAIFAPVKRPPAIQGKEVTEKEAALIDSCNRAVGAALAIQNHPYIKADKFEFYLGQDGKILQDEEATKFGKMLPYLNKKYAIHLHIGEGNWAAGRKGGSDNILNKYQQKLNLYKQSVSIRVKLGIGVGDVNLFHLGGVTDNIIEHRYEYVAVGSGLADAYGSEAQCQPGEVVASPRAWSFVADGKGKPLKKRKKTTKYFIKAEDRKKYAVLVPNEKNSFEELIHKRNMTNFHFSDAKLDLLWSYVPISIAPYIGSENQRREVWLSELRRVTTLFCQLGFSNEYLESLQKANEKSKQVIRLNLVFSDIEKEVFRYEGTINKFLIDDKGSTLLVVFGLPPFAHDDDADRGVRAAHGIIRALSNHGLTGSIGVTTGVCFCGVLGNKMDRREYSVLGECINLSARLMSAVQQRSAEKEYIYIDKPTRLAMRDSALTQEFMKLPNKLPVKGFNLPVEAYRHDYQTSRLISLVPKGQFMCIVSGSSTSDNGYGIKASRATLFYAKRDIQMSELKEQAFFHYFRGMEEKEKEQARDKFDLLWFKFQPTDNFDQGVLLDMNENAKNFPQDIKVLYFELHEAKSKPGEPKVKRRPVFLDDQAHEFDFKKRPSRDGGVEDTLTLQDRLEKTFAKTSKGRLKLVIVEGSYGVGRSFAINQVLKDDKNVRIVRASGDPFRSSTDVCQVWAILLRKQVEQLIEQRVKEGEVVERREDAKGGKVDRQEAVAEIIDQALEKTKELLRVRGAAKARKSKIMRDYASTDLLYHLNALVGSKYKVPSNGNSRLTFRKREMTRLRRRTLNPERESESRENGSDATTNSKNESDLEESERIIRIITAVVVGLAELSPVHLVLVIEQSQFMDPFSWLVLNEIASKWKNASLTVVLSHRLNLMHLKEGEEEETEEDAATKTYDKAKLQYTKNFRADTFADSSIRDNFKTMRFGTLTSINPELSTDDYALIDQTKDIELLYRKTKTLPAVELIEVRSRQENTHDIMCNILKVSSIPVEALILVHYLRVKTSGNPLYINDALKEYRELNLLQLKEKVTGNKVVNEFDFKRQSFLARLDRDELTVPASVENRCGMILDKLNMVGQIGLKIASLIPPFKPDEQNAETETFVITCASTCILARLQQMTKDEEQGDIDADLFKKEFEVALMEKKSSGKLFVIGEMRKIVERIQTGVLEHIATYDFSASEVKEKVLKLEHVIFDAIELQDINVSFCIDDILQFPPEGIRNFADILQKEWERIVEYGIIEIDWGYYERRRKEYADDSVTIEDLAEEHLGEPTRVFYRFQNEWMRESLANRILFKKKDEILTEMREKDFSPLSSNFDARPVWNTARTHTLRLRTQVAIKTS